MKSIIKKSPRMQKIKEKISIKKFKTMEELKQEIRRKMKKRLSNSYLVKITNEGSYLSIAIDKK